MYLKDPALKTGTSVSSWLKNSCKISSILSIQIQDTRKVCKKWSVLLTEYLVKAVDLKEIQVKY